jgi:anthranilate phosphoribosyltransferase
MIQEAIAKVVERTDLSGEEMTVVMEQITEGRATQAQIGAFITALRMKGEVVDEIAAAAGVLRNKSSCIPVRGSKVALDRDEINVDQETIVDTCGTGGDGTSTFNISTTTAFVVAAGGLKVAKHGNRSVSSLCGSADVVEALGVNLDLTPEEVGRCIDEVGIGFLYAPSLHSAMRHVIGPRREIGLRTIFNILGPLANPASATVQVLGVYDQKLTRPMAEVLGRLGCRSAFVVHGHGSYDEISITGPSRLSYLKDGAVTDMTVTPEDMGLKTASPESIRGGDANENAAITRKVLTGEKGPCRDIILLNASAAFTAAGLSKDLKEGVQMAADCIDSGKAMEKLQGLIDLSVCISADRKAAVS